MINQCTFEESYGCTSRNIANGKRRDDIARFRSLSHSFSIRRYLASDIYIFRGYR